MHVDHVPFGTYKAVKWLLYVPKVTPLSIFFCENNRKVYKFHLGFLQVDWLLFFTLKKCNHTQQYHGPLHNINVLFFPFSSVGYSIPS